MIEIDKVRELFPDDNSLNLETLKGAISAMAKENKKYKLFLITLICKEDPVDLFRQWQPDDYDLAILSGDNEGEKENLIKLLPSKTKLLFNQKPEDKLEYIE